MASKNASIHVTINGDAEGFKKSTREAEQQAKGFGSRMDGILAGIGAGAAAAGTMLLAQAGTAVLQYGTDAIGLARDLQSEQAKVGIAFGATAADVEAWAETTAKSLGIAKTDSLAAAGAFGIQFKEMGLASGEAFELSKKLIEVSAAQGALHGTNPSAVMDAISSAGRGEYDSLQALIPTINGAAVETKALEMTGKENAAALTEQEKTLAAYQLVIDGSKVALDNWGTTSDTANAKQQELSARWKDFQTMVGEQLLPILSALTGVLVDDVMPAMESLAPIISRGAETIGILTGFIRDNWAWIGHLAGAFGTIIGPVTSFFTLIWNLISAVVAFKDTARNMFDGISGAASSAFNSVRNIWNSTLGGFGFSLPGFDPPGPGPSFPGLDFHIPSMAVGGFAAAPMLAMVGDNPDGSGEHVIGDTELRKLLRTERGGASITVNFNSVLPPNKRDAGRIIEALRSEYLRAAV